MPTSSFTIEFDEHVAEQKKKYCLDRLADTAAEVRELGERRFEIVCQRARQLAMVGWLLFQSHFAQLCRVTATSGIAEDRADAYLNPPERG